MSCEHRYTDGRSAFQGDCTGVTCRLCGAKLTKDEFIALSSNAYAPEDEKPPKTENEPPKEKAPQKGSTGGRKKAVK